MVRRLSRKAMIFLAVLLIFSLTYRVYDIDEPLETADEFAYYGAGISYWYNIYNLDFNSDSWQENKEHPPLPKYFYGALGGASLFAEHRSELFEEFSYEDAREFLIENKDFTAARWFSALLGTLTIALVFLIAYYFFNFKTAIFSSIALSLTPHFIAHTRIAGIESVTVFFYTLTVFFFFLALQNNSKRYFTLTAISLGLALSSNYNSASLLILLPALFLWYRRNHKVSWPKWYNFVLPIIIPIVIWPTIWQPIKFISSLQHWSYSIQEYFLGALTTAPLHYYLMYFLATAPLILLLFFFISFREIKTKPDFFKSAVLLWFLVHLILQSIVPTVQQDGMRYVLMILPPFALLSGLGFKHVFDYLRAKKQTIHSLIIFILVFIVLLATAISIHPYYLDYYNEAVGGPSTVQENKLFEIGWWGEGISEATNFVSKDAAEGATVTFFVGPADHLIPKLRPDLEFISGKDVEKETGIVNYESDYVVTNNFYLWYHHDIREELDVAGYEPIYQVKARGSTLASVYEHSIL